MNARALSILTALLLGGCSLLFGVDDYDVATQTDAGQRDAGSTDAGQPFDAGEPDSGQPLDAGDAGASDGGPDGLPDLTIGCGTPAEITKGGDVVRVPWTVGNVGMVPGGPLTVAVLMERPAMTEDEVDEYVEVGTTRIPTRVGLSGSETGEVAFTAPDWVLGGENSIRCVVDSLDEVPELDKTNNSADAFLVATGLPDLVAVSVSVQETIGSMTSQRLTTVVRYLIRNDGMTSARSVRVGLGLNIEQGGSGGTCGSETRTVPHLAPGHPASGLVEVEWDVSDCHPWYPNRVFLSVDARDVIVEGNEDNNSVGIDYTPF